MRGGEPTRPRGMPRCVVAANRNATPAGAGVAFSVRGVVRQRFAVLSRKGRLVAVVEVTVMSPRAPMV